VFPPTEGVMGVLAGACSAELGVIIIDVRPLAGVSGGAGKADKLPLEPE